MITPSETKKKELVSYKRDETGHLLCHLCSFKPKPTPTHPHGNPSTLHYHLKKQHEGNCSYVCRHCNYPFLHKLALETHIASRHPETVTNLEMFRCDVAGCEFESITRGNLEIHKARKHCSSTVNQYLDIQEEEKTKIYRCNCCQKNYKSGTAFNYHILKCLNTYNIAVPIQ
jgi:hypothetical protein